MAFPMASVMGPTVGGHFLSIPAERSLACLRAPRPTEIFKAAKVGPCATQVVPLRPVPRCWSSHPLTRKVGLGIAALGNGVPEAV